jgi:hypothetical protein
MLSVDLGGTNEEILKEIEALLPKARERTNIPEQKESKRNHSALSSFINQYALEYLDLLIYCIKPQPTDLDKKNGIPPGLKFSFLKIDIYGT